MSYKILVADDDTGVLSAIKLLLKSKGYSSTTVESPEGLLDALAGQDFDLVLMDLNYSLDTTSGEEGFKLIQRVRQLDDFVPIVIMTGWGTIDVAVRTMQLGANDFIQKPWENDRLLAIIQNQILLARAQKRSQILSRQNDLLQDEANPLGDIQSGSEQMQSVIDTINDIAKSDVSVLFTGENGTGKSMFARYLHSVSSRNKGSFVSVNMGAVTDTLFESEMFGHVKGAFTDAKSSRVGRFEMADEGTLFLDEIANMPYAQQSKLLRVLEEKQFEKVGSSKTQSVDFRLVTATNADVKDLVESERFRKDLLYRINTIEIRIPALRERREDIIPLANAFLASIAKKYGQDISDISPKARAVLQKYDWPGNVRELSHVMERAHVLCRGAAIEVKDLGIADAGLMQANFGEALDFSQDLRSLEALEKEIIELRLDHFDGDANQTATSLGLSRSAFYRKLAKTRQG